MAVVGNTSSEIGDVMILSSNTSLVGISSFTGFADITVGETATRFFDKYFKYSFDGVVFTQWMPLTTANVQSIVINQKQTFFVQFQYIRAGTDTTGLLEWTDTQMMGIFLGFPCDFSIGLTSIFQELICVDPVVEETCVNLLEKLYKTGIIPEYITRGEINGNILIDRDYVSFWGTIACFFSLMITYARTFEQITINYKLLFEYLTQRGIYLCDTEPLPDLQYIARYFYDEIRKRGTNQIYREKGYVFADSTVQAVDGELLRFICKGVCDEFLFLVTDKKDAGLNVNNSSPLFQGTTHYGVTLNKFKEVFRDQDITINDILSNSSEISYNQVNAVSNNLVSAITAPDGKNVMKMVIQPGYNDIEAIFRLRGMEVDIDYEFTFWIQQKNNTRPLINFEGHLFDQLNAPIRTEDVTRPIWPFPGSIITNSFASLISMNQTDVWYFVRLIFFKRNNPQITTQEGQVFPGVGNHLRMTNRNLFSNTQVTPCDMEVRVRLDWSGIDFTDEIWLYDVKCRPLSIPYSTGFVQSAYFNQAWIKYNNQKISKTDFEEAVSYYLLPYDSHLIINYV